MTVEKLATVKCQAKRGVFLLRETFSAVSFNDRTKMSFSFPFRSAGECGESPRLLFLHLLLLLLLFLSIPYGIRDGYYLLAMGKRMNSARFTEHRNLRCGGLSMIQRLKNMEVNLYTKEKTRPICTVALVAAMVVDLVAVLVVEKISFHFLPSGENAARAAVRTDDMASHLVTLSTHEELIATIP